jgi:hypothetical protein
MIGLKRASSNLPDSTALQCIRLADHMTFNFNNNMSTTAVFLDIEKAFDITWHLGLIKLNSSFLSQRKFRVSDKGETFMPRDIQAGVPQGSVLSPMLYSIYINDTPQTPGVYLGLFAEADLNCKPWTNRGLVYTARGRNFNNMLHVR